ncbi:sigma-70 family RNA polymerase sigma factor [Paenibacillus sp. GCM10027626]|uniref:sigma-70 family RNA polymerase sigma factor n=1 Tax=Paenibacillus sp. GCM10027626 TaxID=3273411 RepID=UPI00362C1984
MDELIQRYIETQRTLRALRTLNTDEWERGIIGGMISDCEFALEWLRTGRRPGNRRGIERRARYQREEIMDPFRLQMYMVTRQTDRSMMDSNTGMLQLQEIMDVLSNQERECFEMAYGECMPHTEIARYLGLSRGNVSTLLQRARKKLAKKIAE